MTHFLIIKDPNTQRVSVLLSISSQQSEVTESGFSIWQHKVGKWMNTEQRRAPCQASCVREPGLTQTQPNLGLVKRHWPSWWWTPDHQQKPLLLHTTQKASIHPRGYVLTGPSVKRTHLPLKIRPFQLTLASCWQIIQHEAGLSGGLAGIYCLIMNNHCGNLLI